MMTSRSLICLLENQNGGKLQKNCLSNRICVSVFSILHEIIALLIAEYDDRILKLNTGTFFNK
jgi:hypothetical protein